MTKHYFKLLILLLPIGLLAQDNSQDTIMIGLSIPEIVFAEDKDETERLLSPSKIEKIDAVKIFETAPSTSADALQKTGAVMIQMSQSGGGSPIIRGFEANRVLLVVDGVRLNNAIYRSGHLQNSISVSPLMLDNIDIIFGPSSVKYGSDALGGVVHYHTKSPKKGQLWKANLLQRYTSANNGVNLYFDQSWSKGKWGFLQAINLNRFGNLKMGAQRNHGYENWGNEEHITNGKEQLRTAYDQVDFIQRIRFDASQHLSYKLNLQLSSTTNLNRFDQLNDLSGGTPKYTEWYYGPQKRLLLSLGTEHQKKTVFYDSFNNTLSYQQLEESRNSQKLNADLIERIENVSVFANTADFIKKWDYNTLNYGIDLQHNIVRSSATENYNTRYADGGSDMTSLSVYSQYKYPFSKSSYFSVGARYSKVQLNGKFNETQSLGLPFNAVQLDNDAITASAGLKWDMGKGWESTIAASTGFRSPNVDDVTKVFEKSGKLTVPNEDLSPEFSKNIELTINKSLGKSYLSATYYYTLLEDAIVKQAFSLNGQDSLWYDGEYLPVYANTNSQDAFLFGYNAKAYIHLNKHWSSTHTISYTYGKDEGADALLDHIPPLYGKSQIDWVKNNYRLGLFAFYNAWKKAEDYSPNGSDNLDEATADGTPAWWTLNLSCSINLSDKLVAQLNVENILDVHYKTFSSGISAPGRNVILSIKTEF
ncbi:MAG: TonB-dependent receptor [Flavobacteriales bacterium]|nr:TonB-dependent receptor [Flavobacteriales bacterium]